MDGYGKLNIGAIALLGALCALIFGAIRYNLSVSTIVMTRLPHTIVVDAGHGGEDGGTTGVSGASESRLNLEIALRLEQLLPFCGFQPIMIRTTDTAIYSEGCETFSEKKISDLKNRVALINQIHPAMMISIHQNHFSQNRISGAQVFYAKIPGSRDMAQSTQETLRVMLDPNNRRVCKSANSIYLMENIQCPGILVECGFLSNSREEAFLQQADYQKKIVCAITGALTQYVTKGGNDIEI